MAIAFLALGSNLGDRQSAIEQAIKLLKSHGVKLIRSSTIIETEPVGGPAGQGQFLNAVLKVSTDYSPEQLLEIILYIEHRLGRVRKMLNGPRIIDIDILLYDDIKMISPRLVIPHPRMAMRGFVMHPLKEISPDMHEEIAYASR